MTEILNQEEYQFAINAAITAAKASTCARSKCGSVIVKGYEIIGIGWNSQPGSCDGVECECFKDTIPRTFKSDRNCCVHAEQRAIMDALKHNSDKIEGSILFFVRLDENDEAKMSGRPYCTICSKMALDVQISKFVLWHNEGWTAYDTDEYNKLSFKYIED